MHLHTDVRLVFADGVTLLHRVIHFAGEGLEQGIAHRHAGGLGYVQK